MNIIKEMKWWSRRRDGELDARSERKLDARDTHPALIEEAVEQWDEIGDRLRRQPIPTPPAEVMWSDVRRSIHLLKAQQREAVRTAVRLDWAAITATLVLFLGVGFFGLRILTPHTVQAGQPRVEWVEAELPGAGAMVYEDGVSGAVVIWMVTPDAVPSNGGAL